MCLQTPTDTGSSRVKSFHENWMKSPFSSPILPILSLFRSLHRRRRLSFSFFHFPLIRNVFTPNSNVNKASSRVSLTRAISVFPRANENVIALIRIEFGTTDGPFHFQKNIAEGEKRRNERLGLQRVRGGKGKPEYILFFVFTPFTAPQ